MRPITLLVNSRTATDARIAAKFGTATPAEIIAQSPQLAETVEYMLIQAVGAHDYLRLRRASMGLPRRSRAELNTLIAQQAEAAAKSADICARAATRNICARVR